ncbi:ketopantoate reductase family protein [Cognaticolwellia mytili]|uniref:ketopantoate reductase family protein n=1 Tax=Cognaticolwellia mytili TaxID=1888913 RepID=UPI000A16F8E4|nr:2-dehydropantoate 2-reductase [Cognaticolwellia mytili]
MNIVIVGQGAIGLLWYHRLINNSSNRVSLLCSARIISQPTETFFTSIENQTTRQPLISANNAALATADIILFCLKSYHISSALAPIFKQVSAKAVIVFCHNGMGAIENLAKLSQPCYALLTTHGSKIISPLHAQHTGLGHNDLGLISGKPPLIQEQIIKTLATALPSLTLSNNIKAKQWLKLAINCVINPITALDDVNNGQLLNNNYAVLIDQVLKEIIAVAACEGIRFGYNELKLQVLAVARKTAKNCSSMRSDILQQRPTEIDYINGYIVSLAKKNGLCVPTNARLVQRVKNITL